MNLGVNVFFTGLKIFLSRAIFTMLQFCTKQKCWRCGAQLHVIQQCYGQPGHVGAGSVCSGLLLNASLGWKSVTTLGWQLSTGTKCSVCRYTPHARVLW